MSHLRYPLIGDPSYGGRTRIPKAATQVLIDTLRQFPRQALHAQALGLVHPRSEELLQWDVPLPPDMQHLLQVLREHDRENIDDAAY
jgi:23S rRNA pseudouridine1911/1915/1917 synthase